MKTLGIRKVTEVIMQCQKRALLGTLKDSEKHHENVKRIVKYHVYVYNSCFKEYIHS